MIIPDKIKCGVWGFVLAASVLAARGNPFSRPYTLALKNITMEGDLTLPCPIRTLALDEKTGVEVWLEHKLEMLDYGQARSRFILHPFETGVFSRGPKVFVWLRPGGGEIKFSEKQAGTLDSSLRWPRHWPDRLAAQPVQYYEANGVELLISESNRQVVREDGWELYHHNGELESIISPKGGVWKVAANGKRINLISRENEQVVALEWRPDLTPDRMVAGSDSFRFISDANSSLREVHRLQDKIYEFTYDNQGLISKADTPSAIGIAFSWHEVPDFSRGDTSYALPFTLAKAGALSYEYRNDDGVITLRTFLGKKPEGALTIVTRYGRIISVR